MSILTAITVLLTNERALALEPQRMMTGNPVSNYNPVGIAIKTLLELKALEETNVTVDIIPSSSTNADLVALLSGEADIVFTDAATLKAAITKQPPFDEFDNAGNIRSVATLWPDVAHLIVRRHHVRTGQLDDFRNLIGESVSFGPKSTPANAASRYLFAQAGVYYEQLFQLADLNQNDAKTAFVEGTISGISSFTNEKDQRIEDIFSNVQSDAMFLSINDQLLTEFNDADFPIWHRYIIKAGTYSNQPEDIASIAQNNFLVVRSDYLEQDAYYVSKTIFENLKFVEVLHSAGAQIRRENNTSGQIVPQHSGTQKYFDEAAHCAGLFCLFQ